MAMGFERREAVTEQPKMTARQVESVAVFPNSHLRSIGREQRAFVPLPNALKVLGRWIVPSLFEIPNQENHLTQPRHDPSIIAQLVGTYGTLRKQSASEWTGTIPLPKSVQVFYETVGPVKVTIPAGGSPVSLPSLDKLWGMQAGYRWNGLTGERCPDWPENWLLVAECNADPFILEIESGRILGAPSLHLPTFLKWPAR
jgi:hypothetical protein